MERDTPFGWLPGHRAAHGSARISCQGLGIVLRCSRMLVSAKERQGQDAVGLPCEHRSGRHGERPREEAPLLLSARLSEEEKLLSLLLLCVFSRRSRDFKQSPARASVPPAARPGLIRGAETRRGRPGVQGGRGGQRASPRHGFAAVETAVCSVLPSARRLARRCALIACPALSERRRSAIRFGGPIAAQLEPHPVPPVEKNLLTRSSSANMTE